MKAKFKSGDHVIYSVNNSELLLDTQIIQILPQNFALVRFIGNKVHITTLKKNKRFK